MQNLLELSVPTLVRMVGAESFNEGRAVLTTSAKQEERMSMFPDAKGLEEDDVGAEKAKMLGMDGESDGLNSISLV